MDDIYAEAVADQTVLAMRLGMVKERFVHIEDILYFQSDPHVGAAIPHSS